MRLSLADYALVFAALTLSGCQPRPAAVGSPAPVATTTSSRAFTAVTFERTPCFGTCPVYRVSVSGSGSVRFEGTRNVDSVGTFSGQLTAAAVASLQRAFEHAQYSALDDKYGYGLANCREYGTDASRIITSLTTSSRTKMVDHDLGCANVPARLAELYRQFDQIVGTARWTGQR